MHMLKRLQQNSDVVMASAVFGLLAIMIVPLPSFVMDLLLAVSVSLSLLIFLVTLYIRKPLDFSVFPTLLLITTLFRLSLNVASTRLILLNGGDGSRAAGAVIEAFGQFVVGGNYVVGFVVFAILVVINFVVISKGATRIAEVSARFTLDAMPGKQMAIDAELNAGLIDETQARRRRDEVSREADFFGSMDGASKFIRGDAIAGILITVVNCVGGIVIGAVQQGMSIAEAGMNYTLLTIGDGLVGQIPALIISSAAGLLVTRVPDEDRKRLDHQFGDQLFGEPRVIGLLVFTILGFALIPGLRLPFTLIGGVVGALAYQLRNQAAEPEVEQEETGVAQEPTRPVQPEDLLPLEALSFEVGIDIIYLVDRSKDGELLERIQRVRNQFARDLGVVLPPVHIRDNLRLGGGEYVVKIRGEEVGRGRVHARRHLAIDPGTATGKIKGIQGQDPVFGLPAWWIPDGMVLKAQARNYTVVDVATVLTTHFTELMHRHAHELFDIAQLSDGLERVGERLPRLVEELVPDPLPRQVVLRVFRNLIREGVSVRDVQSILEALGDYADRTRNPDVLTEFVRQRLSRHISRKFSDEEGVLHYLGLAPEVEDAVSRGLQGGDGGSASLVLDPEVARRIVDSVRQQVEGYSGPEQVVILCPPLARGPFKRMLERVLPQVPILSPAELLPGVKLDCVGAIALAPRGRGPRPVRPAPRPQA
jgi:flagellar biosynthesis protein FlhA